MLDQRVKLRSGLAARTAEPITVLISNTSNTPIVIEAGVPIGIIQKRVDWKEEELLNKYKEYFARKISIHHANQVISPGSRRQRSD